MAGTDIEKKSLEAHVELCAERYTTLENKLNNLGTRMTNLETHVLEIKDALGNAKSDSLRQLVTIGTTIVGVLLTAVIGLIVHLILK